MWRACLVISRQRRESARHFPSIIKWPTLLATELGDLTSRSLSRAKASPTTLDDESRAVDTCPAASLCVKTAHLINRYNTKRMASSPVVWAHTHVPTVGIKETGVKKKKEGKCHHGDRPNVTGCFSLFFFGLARVAEMDLRLHFHSDDDINERRLCPDHVLVSHFTGPCTLQ